MSSEKFKVSVVIPTYNRCADLVYTLKSLNRQSLDNNSFEAIVVDDGSSDETFRVTKQFENLLNLKYVYQRDEGYRPASARNLGIKVAEGSICLFIDSGILLKQDCLMQHVKIHQKKANIAVIGYTYGYTKQGETAQELLKIIDPEDADASISRLVEKGKFLDLRENIFKKYDDKVHKLNAPWTLFWGGHLSVKRKALLKVKLFDENYDGNWGCEDNDLGYRLQQANLSLFFYRKAAVLHLPHDSDMELKKAQGYRNCKYFHDKFPSAETKLFLEYYTREIVGDEVVDFHEIIKREAERPVQVLVK